MINFTETILGATHSNAGNQNITDKGRDSIGILYSEASLYMNEVHVMMFDIHTKYDTYAEASFMSHIGAFVKKIMDVICYPYTKMSDFINLSYKRREFRKAAKKGIVAPVDYGDRVVLLPSKYPLDALILQSLYNIIKNTKLASVNAIDENARKEYTEIIRQVKEVVDNYKEGFAKLLALYKNEEHKQNMDLDALVMMLKLHNNNIHDNYLKLEYLFNTIYATYTREAIFRHEVEKMNMLPNGKPVVQYYSRFKKPANKVLPDIKKMFVLLDKINKEAGNKDIDYNHIEDLAFDFWKLYNDIVNLNSNLSFAQACDATPDNLADAVMNADATLFETDLDGISTLVDMTWDERKWDENNAYYNKTEVVQIAKKAGLLDFTDYVENKNTDYTNLKYLKGGVGKVIMTCLDELNDIIKETNLSMIYYTMVIITIGDNMCIEIIDRMLKDDSEFSLALMANYKPQ